MFPQTPIKTIDFSNVFPRKLPIKLEICSGHGDWIIEKASKSLNSANWLALELRFERVYTIFSKLTFKNLENLIILSGEASYILSNYIEASSLEEIFINYPDPPVWEYSQWLLITEKFLRIINNLLIKGKCLTIVTDDKDYAGLMIREFKKVKDLFKSKIKDKDFTNEIPKEYGSSYFDRFWTQGNRKTRFFLQYEALKRKS